VGTGAAISAKHRPRRGSVLNVVLDWGSAFSVTAAFFCLIAAGVARVKFRDGRRAFYLLAACYVWFFPVHLWFWQFILRGPSPTGTGYILEAISQIGPPLVWLIWSCFHRFRPVVTAVVLIYLFSLVLQLFSFIYWSYGGTNNFNIALSHLDSFYVALGTLTTAGTGSISAVSETARGIQTLQMGIDLAIVGFAVALVVARYSNLFPRVQPRVRDTAGTAVERKAKIEELRRLLGEVEAATTEECAPAETHEPVRAADRPPVRRGSPAPRVRIRPPGMRPRRASHR
jgi:hypothetical protein